MAIAVRHETLVHLASVVANKFHHQGHKGHEAGTYPFPAGVSVFAPFAVDSMDLTAKAAKRAKVTGAD